MAPLAIIAKQAGIGVTGSDVPQEFITDKELEDNGIKAFEGFSSENIKNPDLVIATGAHEGSENIEVKTAIEKGIEVEELYVDRGQLDDVFRHLTLNSK